MQAREASDEQLWEACRRLDSDFEPHGQRKGEGSRESWSDCATCRWFLELSRHWADWGVCANPRSPRAGLLTHWEQGCGEFEQEKEPLHETARRARCDFKSAFEDLLREQVGDFIREEVRKANDPCRDEESRDPEPEEMDARPLFFLLRRILRHADEDFRPPAIEAMAAAVRGESGRYWQLARREWARDLGEDLPAIRLPGNFQELEEGFWARVQATVRAALAARGAEPNG